MSPPSPFQFTFDVGPGMPAGGDLRERRDANSKEVPASHRRLQAGLENALSINPALYPIALDASSGLVQLVSLSREDYETASFLDSRLLKPDMPIETHQYDDVRRSVGHLPKRCHFVFHISHVGSTLLSRLIGKHALLFSVREPAILRPLAEIGAWLNSPDCPWPVARFDDHLDVFLKLFSRVFDSEQTAVIKATSFVAEIAVMLMERVPESRSLLMFVTPDVFLKALLDGAMSDITNKSAVRSARLQRRIGSGFPQSRDFSAGEVVAMSWLCEMLALDAAANRFPDRVFWIDFDLFLQSPADQLIAALNHLGVPVTANDAQSILSGSTMNEYAKEPSVRFDSSTRARILQRSETRHSHEIRKGLDWLERLGRESSLVQRILDRFATHAKS